MPTVRQSVTAAMRKARLLDPEETPEAIELTNGLAVLQSLYAGWVNGGSFGRLTDVIASDDYQAKENERIRDGGFTITLPTTIDDCGGVRKPRDLAVVVTTGATPTMKVYDAATDAWVSLLDLGRDDEAPLAARDPDGFACALAVRYAEEYGKQVGPATVAAARTFISQLTGRAGAERTTVRADYF